MITMQNSSLPELTTPQLEVMRIIMRLRSEHPFNKTPSFEEIRLIIGKVRSTAGYHVGQLKRKNAAGLSWLDTDRKPTEKAEAWFAARSST